VAKSQVVHSLDTISKGTQAHVHSATGDDHCEALLRYGTDLTAAAEALDPVIGRDEEIRRVIRVLSRRTKNNPVLIGEPVRGSCCSQPRAP